MAAVSQLLISLRHLDFFSAATMYLFTVYSVLIMLQVNRMSVPDERNILKWGKIKCIALFNQFFHSRLPLALTLGISLLTPSRKHPSLCIGMFMLGSVDFCGGFTVTKVPCFVHQRCQYFKEDTWKSYLYDIILVQCGICNVVWAKPVALQKRKCLCDSQSHLLLPRQSPSPGGKWQMQASDGLTGMQTCYISSSNNYSFFNITMVLHVKRPLNPFSLYFSREEISRVIIYKAV